MVYQPFVSIIIPSRNEKDHISGILDACLALDYPHFEVIVVDDSLDETPDLVNRYASRGVKLVHRNENRNGCCGARNLGMKLARGEIIVLFNADDRPPIDFLARILQHYEDGADYVICKSHVLNQETIWGRYHYVEEMTTFDPDPEWSEGFSCRKEAAEDVGYIPGDFLVPFCRDFMFGMRLNKAGYKKVVDRTIVVYHISPSSLKEYWGNQKWRGTFAAPFNYYFKHLPLVIVWLRELLKFIRSILRYICVLPVALKLFRASRLSPKKYVDFPGFFYVAIIQDLARTVGNLQGVMRVSQNTGSGRK